MTSYKIRAFVIFGVSALVLAIVLFSFPINLFDGVIEIDSPIGEYTEERPLSLSYFIGLGYEEQDMEYVKDFHLTTKGWVMALVFILGFPALLAYRIYLKYSSRK